MESVPLTNIVSLVHLCLVAAFFGLYLCEAVIEGYGAHRNEFHRSAIRYHYLMDIFVELPLMFAILATGVLLAVLVDELTPLHWILIACGTIAVFFCPFCFVRYVRTRNRLVEEGTTDDAMLDEPRRRMGVWTLSLFNPLLIAALAIGSWLAYQRVLESMHG
jgi:hypothetical protein